MYNNMSELLELSMRKKVPLSEVILENEEMLSSLSKDQIFEKLEMRYQVMERSVEKALEQSLPTVGSLIEGISMTQYQYALRDKTACGSFINIVMARALSGSETNASMGKICAAPTAGACGILPAVLVSISERENIARRKTLEGLLTASGIGAIIMKNASVAGAEAGCQAECGVAAAMAAAATVELLGGTQEAALNSVALVLMNCMGLVCDPVAGLVQVPCAQRNASQAINALLSADLALAGMISPIPVDEVIEAMYKVGKLLPASLKETSMGGIAATKTGKEINNRIFKGTS
jgi:L-serine dehydratase